MKLRAKNNNYNSNTVQSLSSNSEKNKKIKIMRNQRSYLNEFSKVQDNIKNNNFILNENIEIKNYGAVYMNQNDNSFELTNDKNFNKGNRVVELHFQKTLFEKG